MYRTLRAAVAICLATALCLPATAFATNEDAALAHPETPAVAHEHNGESAPISDNPCMPAQEELDAYAADGSLDARLAFQESLENDSFDSGLIAQARQREAHVTGSEDASTLSVPTNWKSGMPTTGTAHVLALRISFPEGGPDEPAGVPTADDSADALQNIIGPITEGVECDASPDTTQDPAVNVYPYESLHDYYYRSSYQKLSIDGATFNYTAAHPASYYSWDMEVLFTEAIAALDDRIDYSKFDGNGDSLIDAVYLHFSCTTPQWGTEWWSNERQATSEAAAVTYDGVRLWNIVTLHNPSNSPDGVRTAIHETGHVLGLPDLYSYNNQSPSTGSLTFDMMDTNTGDHNAFSKWMLGWVADEDITRIVADDEGITVKRGTSPAETIPTPSGQTHSESVEATLRTYAEAQACGGIVAASSSHDLIDGAGLFSSLYLAQYDSFANNQSVSFNMEGVGTTNLPAGFRVFRVQGGLNADGSDFARTNTFGRVHDQLIELVDPDGTIPHQTSNGVLYAAGATEYGCMFREGDVLSPTTTPSTNFYEQLNLGFTGLSLSFGACDDTTGTVSVSYSSEHKPDPTNFTIVRADEHAVSNIDSLALTASAPVLINTAIEQGASFNPYLLVDGQVVSTKPSASGSAITVQYAFSASLAASATSLELVFPAKAFIIGNINGQKIYSPEIRIPLTLEASPAIQAEGGWTDTAIDTFTHAVSNIATFEDGTQRFFQVANGVLRMCTVDASDPTRISAVSLADFELPFGAGANLQAFVTGPTSAFVLAKSPNDTESGGQGFWIDTATGAVTAQASALPLSSNAPVASGTAMLFSEFTFQRGICLVAISPNEDGTVSKRYGYVEYSGFQNVAAYGGSDEIALWTTLAEGDAPQLSAALYKAEDIMRAVQSEGFDSFDELAAAGFPSITGVTPVLAFKKSAAYELSAMAHTDAGYCAVLRSLRTHPDAESSTMVTLASIGPDGSVSDRSAINIEDGLTACKLVPARYGTLAAVFSSATDVSATSTQRTVFFTAEHEKLSTLSTSSTAAGSWLADGRWLGIGWFIQQLSPGAGSPDMSASEANSSADENASVSIASAASPAYKSESEYVLYTITGVLDDEPDNPPLPVDPDDPDEPAAPSESGEEAGSDSASGQNESTLAITGDATPIAPITVVAFGAAILALIAAAALARTTYGRTCDKSE